MEFALFVIILLLSFIPYMIICNQFKEWSDKFDEKYISGIVDSKDGVKYWGLMSISIIIVSIPCIAWMLLMFGTSNTTIIQTLIIPAIYGLYKSIKFSIDWCVKS